MTSGRHFQLPKETSDNLNAIVNQLSREDKTLNRSEIVTALIDALFQHCGNSESYGAALDDFTQLRFRKRR